MSDNLNEYDDIEELIGTKSSKPSKQETIPQALYNKVLDKFIISRESGKYKYRYTSNKKPVSSLKAAQILHEEFAVEEDQAATLLKQISESYIKQVEEEEKKVKESTSQALDTYAEFIEKRNKLLSFYMYCTYSGSDQPQAKLFPRVYDTLINESERLHYGQGLTATDSGTFSLHMALFSHFYPEAIKLQNLYDKAKDEIRNTKVSDDNKKTIEARKKQLGTSLKQHLGSFNLVEENCHFSPKPPKTMTDNPAEPHHLFFDPALLPEGEYPSWQEFMNKFTMQKESQRIFMMWIGMLFTPFKGCRQALWIQGFGGDGKSAAVRVLKKFMGSAAYEIGNLEHNHSLEGVDSARLVVASDCENRKLLLKKEVKQLTGGDTVRINPKGKMEIEIKDGDWKVLVHSNHLPEMDLTKKSQASRVILLQIDEEKNNKGKHMTDSGQLGGDIGFEEGLDQEFPCFLKACIDLFKEEIIDNPKKPVNIPLPKEVTNSMKNKLTLDDSVTVSAFIEDRLIIDTKKDFSMRKIDIKTSFDNYCVELKSKPSSTFSLNDLYTTLEKLGAEPMVEEVNGLQRHVFKHVTTLAEAANKNTKVDVDVFEDEVLL